MQIDLNDKAANAARTAMFIAQGLIKAAPPATPMMKRQIRATLARKCGRAHDMHFRERLAASVRKLRGEFTVKSATLAYSKATLDAGRRFQVGRYIKDQVAAGEIVEVRPKVGPRAAVYRNVK
jgi:hypothetical protein